MNTLIPWLLSFGLIGQFVVLAIFVLLIAVMIEGAVIFMWTGKR